MACHHDWSEKEFDWKGLADAIHYITDTLTRYGRIAAHGKEKWGCARISVSIGYPSLHTLTYPRYVYNQFPNWLWRLDCNYIGPVIRFLIGKPLAKWQMYLYGATYRKAIKKWPHLQAEILNDADYKELIGAGFKVEKIVDENGEKVTLTHTLDSAGNIAGTWSCYTNE